MFSLLSSVLITNTIYIIFGKLFNKTDVYNLKNFSETAITGFIYISFLALIINFFLPLSVNLNTLMIILIFVFFLVKKKTFTKNEIIILITSSLFCFFFILLDTVYRPDAGLYHLPFTKIINNEKIIFGLTNLHFRYGHISIIQYSSALNNNFFLGNNGILLPLVSIYCFLVFYFLSDLLDFLINKDEAHNRLSVFFSSLILLYIAYKINRYGEFGNDAVGNLFFFFLISKLINYNRFNYIKFNKIYLISAFAVLNKFTFLFSLLIPLYIFLKDKFSLNKVLFSIPTLLLLLWILRNIITSGCIIYPQINTCFTELKWSNEKEIVLQSESGEAWAKDWPNRINKNLSMEEYNKSFNWLNTWKNNHGKKIIKILFPYIILLLLIYLYFRYKVNKKNIFQIKNFNFYLAILTSIIGTIFFFLKFPIYRYGYSYLITFIILSLIFFVKFNDFLKIKRLCIFVLILFSLSFTYKQTDRYIKFYNSRGFTPEIYNNTKQHKTIFVNDKNFYNISLNGSCMYDANLCALTQNDNLRIFKKFSYKFFEIIK